MTTIKFIKYHRNHTNRNNSTLILLWFYCRLINTGHTHKVRKYRIAQIHGRLHNETWRHPSMALLVCGIILAEVTCLYMTLTSRDVLSPPGFFMFALIGNNMVFVIHYYFKLVSYPDIKSDKLRNTWKQKKDKWVRAYLRSCHPIKLSLGDGTFFDKMTSLKIWQFCIETLVDILLI